MARPLRVNLAGGFYHVTSRGNERHAIFADDHDRRQFLEALGGLAERFQIALHGYVLMGNHFHLIVELGEANLSMAMQWLNGSYSQYFNRRHQRSGHLLQGRFSGVLVDWEEWGLELGRYVHLNPVRVAAYGLGKSARQRQRKGMGSPPTTEQVKSWLHLLEEYPWSSYRAYVGKAKRPEWLSCGKSLQWVGGDSRKGRRAYREYVTAGVLEGVDLELWKNLKGQMVLGDEDFLNRIRGLLSGDEREQPELRQLRERPSWAEAVKAVELARGERWEQFRDRQGDVGRNLVLWLARRHCGLKLRELGELAGGLDYRSVGSALRYLEQRLSQDRILRQLQAKAKKSLLKNKEI